MNNKLTNKTITISNFKSRNISLDLHYFILGLIFLILFVINTLLLNSKPIIKIDHYFQEVMVSIESTSLTPIFKIISNLGNFYLIAPLLIFLTILPKKYLRLSFKYKILGTILTSVILNTIIKNIIQRPRPDLNRLIEVSSFSYPSGHSMNNIALYTIFFLIILNTSINSPSKIITGFIFFTFIILIDISRMYLGVHYFSDVFGGFLIGLSIALFIFSLNIFKAYLKDNN